MKKLLGCLLLLLCAVLSKAQTISLSGTVSNFDLLDKAKVIYLYIPLNIKATDFENLCFPDTHPAFVQMGGDSEAEFCNGIEFKFNKEKIALALTVRMDSLPMQGIYAVNVQYTTDKNTVKNKTYSLLSFNLVRPPATLESLNTVTITDEQFFALHYDAVCIHETSKRTPVRDLKFYDPVLPGQKTAGLLCFKENNFIGAGDQTNFYFSVNQKVMNGIDYGTNTGKLYFSSNMLSAPVPVIFVVIRKLWTGWIIFTVILGLIAGYLVRQLLTTKRDNEAVQVTGLQLVADIGDFEKSITAGDIDAQLVGYTAQIMTIIKTNLNALVPNATQALLDIQQVQKDFNQVKQSVENTLIQQKNKIEDLDKALNNPALSNDVTKYLAIAFQLLPATQTAFDAKNLDALQTALDAVDNAIILAISNYKLYFTGVGGYLTITANYPNVIPVTTTTISANVTGYLSTLQMIAYDPTKPANSILAIDNSQRTFESIPQSINTLFAIEFMNAKKNPLKVPLLTDLNKWLKVIEDMIVNPGMVTNPLQYLQSALISNPNLISDIVNGWNTAVIGVAAGAAGGAPPAIAIPPTIMASLKSPLKLGNAFIQQSNILPTLARARRKYLLYNLLQSFILAILISLGAYKSLEATFIGHFTEFIGIFLFAFSLDLSVANVVQFKATVS